MALGVLAVIPVASATGEIVRGPQGVPGGSPDVTPTVDSRSAMPRVQIRGRSCDLVSTPTYRAITGLVFRGGNHRRWRTRALRSWQQRGRPHPVTVGAIALETIGGPILLAWQRRVSSNAV